MNLKDLDVTLIEPFGNKLICTEVKTENEAKTEAGIILTSDPDDGNIQIAKVIAVGPGDRDLYGVLHPTRIKVGDYVLHTKFGSTWQRIGTEMYLILRENEIIGKYEGEVTQPEK